MGFMDKLKGVFGKGEDDDYSGVPISLEGMDEEETEDEELIEPEIGFLPSDAEIPSSTIEQQLEGAKQLGFEEYLDVEESLPPPSGLTEAQVEIADVQSQQMDADDQIAKDEEEAEERAEMEREWELRKREKDPNYTPDYNIIPEEDSEDFAQMSEGEQTRLWELREKELLIGEESQYPLRETSGIETSVSEEVETQVYPKPEEESIPIHGPLMLTPEEGTPMAARADVASGSEEAEADANKQSDMPAIKILARRLLHEIPGRYELNLSDEDTRLKISYPEELETELQVLRLERDAKIKEKTEQTYPEESMTDEELKRQYAERNLEWLKEVAVETPPAESKVEGYESETEKSKFQKVRESIEADSDAGTLDKVKAELIEQLIEIPMANGKRVREMSDNAVNVLMAKWKGMTVEDLRIEKQKLKEIDEMRSEAIKTHKQKLEAHEREFKQRAFEAGIKTEQEKAELELIKKYGTPEEKAKIKADEEYDRVEKERKEAQRKKELELGKKQIREMRSETKQLGSKQSKDKLYSDFMEEIGKALEGAYANPKRGQVINKQVDLLLKMAEASEEGVTPELLSKAKRLRERAERKWKERAERVITGTGKATKDVITYSEKPIRGLAKATRRGGEGYKRQWGEQGAQKIFGQSSIIPEGAQTRKPLMHSLEGEPKLKDSPLSTIGIKEQAALATGRGMIDTRRGISVGPSEPAGVLGTPAGGAKYMIGGPKQKMDVSAKEMSVFDFIGSKSRPLDTGVQAVTARAGIPATPGLYVSGTPSIKRMDVKQLL